RHALRAYGEPYGVTCCTRSPLAVVSDTGVGEYAVDDVVGAVHLRGEVPPIRRSGEAALHASAAEGWGSCRAIDQQGVAVQETRLAGGALFGALDLVAHLLRLVGQQRDEAGMRHLHNVLVGAPPQAGVLLAERVRADAERPDALSHQQ